jgi:PAS domain S-box-containing protein
MAKKPTYKALEKRVKELEAICRGYEKSSPKEFEKSEDKGWENGKEYRSLEESNQEKERFRLLIEKAPLGISLIDLEGKFKYLNPKFIELFGYTLEDIPKEQDWLENAYPDTKYRNYVISTWNKDQGKEKGTEIGPRTFHVKCKDDTEKIINFRSVEMENWDKLVIYENVTEKTHIDSQIQQGQKMEALGILVAGVAHEINNPINTIMNNAPLLHKVWHDLQPLVEERAKKEPGSRYGGLTSDFLQENLDQLVSDIDMAANRVASIVKGLKDFSRKTEPLEKQQVNINTAVENVIRLASTTLRKSGIKMEFNLEPDLPLIRANLQNLEQIILNLALNAVQAIDHDHGHIKIATTHNKKQGIVVLFIEDNGKGIDPSFSDKIFDPFFTGYQMTGGTGLGLAITQNLVSANDGEITFKSRTRKGTTFQVSFPVGFKRAPFTILLVDDDESMLKMMNKALTKDRPYTVELASNGIEALIRIGTYSPDLLILDVFMPQMDGVEVCRVIQKHSELSTMNVIILTAYPGHDKVQQIAEMGFTKVLAKPFDLQDFMKEVDGVLMDKG